MGEQTIGRATIEPGWRWSVDLRPTMGTQWCTFRHLGIALSGRFHVLMEDGHEMDVGPEDVFDIPPGHDAWVVGDEPFETVEIAGIYGYGRRVAGETYVASLLITDVVDSTAMLDQLGEPEWRRVQAAHYEQMRRILDRHRGVEVTTTGDGMLSTFDSAARAVRAAAEIHDAGEGLGIRIRAGIHTGEVEAVPGNLRGLAVHLAAPNRCCGRARRDARQHHRPRNDHCPGPGLRGSRQPRAEGHKRPTAALLGSHHRLNHCRGHVHETKKKEPARPVRPVGSLSRRIRLLGRWPNPASGSP
jgi:hypothetical protein